MCGAGWIARLAGAVLAVMAAGAVAQEGVPARVVSINLCTDQLAMMLAAEGQLHSVSHIATDRHVSAMADAAEGYVTNHGLAEEIYLMQPDLVLAGPHAAQASTAMLKRLGIPVVVVPAAATLEDIPDRIRRMGAVLHREAEAARMAGAFELRLAGLRAEVGERPSAVLFNANGYTSGAGTLAGQILEAAGFENAAVEAGYGAGMKLPLEVLAMIRPDVVITSQTYPGASRSEEVMAHPVVRALRDDRAGGVTTGHDWVCGTPYVLRAIEELGAVRRAVTGGAQ